MPLGTQGSSRGSAQRTVAIFGGSFDPPHIAHVLAVTYALSVELIDEVLVIPVFQHSFAKELAPFEDRAAMCRLAFEWISGVCVSEVERELGGESRTLRTLEHLHNVHPDWSLRLLVGADVLLDASQWHRFDRVIELAPLLVLGRRGVERPDAPEPLLPRVSSTHLRAAIQSGNVADVRHLLPRSVIDYALARGLYRSDTP
jgi:nicotinate-nucleotide adenylyltransferase